MLWRLIAMTINPFKLRRQLKNWQINCGRIYASREDAIKVIETITGKQYEDR